MKASVIQILFISILINIPIHTIAQPKYELVRQELSNWDPIRGNWLADSYEALEKGHAVPDRMFEEDLTPAELYQLAPEQTKKNIQKIIEQQPSIPEIVSRISSVAPSVGPDGIQRIALEDSPNSTSNQRNTRQTVNSTGNYNGIFRNSNCNLIQGRSYGDPHIRTFDGSTFSFQTVGEYILARSRDGQFEVQGRQKAETDKVSLNSAVAMNVAGDQVGIYAQDIPNRQNAPLRVNGQSVFITNDTYFLPSGGTVQQSGKKYIVTWPTGERVQADMITSSGRSFLNLSIFVYDCYGDYSGVLGNGNGNRNDDFQANGRNLSSGVVFDPFDDRQWDSRSARAERDQLIFLARDFGGQYLVNDRTSLFEYDFGLSTWSFVDPSFPRVHITMNDISVSQRERARQECIRQGIARDELSACIMDFSHANISPTPRSSTPDRVTGRSTTPVANPRPNVNRSDAGGGQGVRTPWETGRTQDDTKPTTRSSSSEPAIRENRTINERTNSDDVINTTRNPIDRTTVPITKPTIERSPLPNGKQDGERNDRNQPTSRPSSNPTIERRSLDTPSNNATDDTAPIINKPVSNKPENVSRTPIQENSTRQTNDRINTNGNTSPSSRPTTNIENTRVKETSTPNSTSRVRSIPTSPTRNSGTISNTPGSRGTFSAPNTGGRR